MNFLEGLNPKQEEAVRLVDRHLLVVAGAGSGKTRVLTHKIAFLIEACGEPPSTIAAMTFSNKAAREMTERVRHLLPSFEQPRWIGTFHSTCLKILKEFHLEARLSSTFTVYDEADQLSLLKRILNELNLDPKTHPPKGLRHVIDRAKNETDNIIPYLANSGSLPSKDLEAIQMYERALETHQALDFGSLLTRTVRLLGESSQVAEILRDRWGRILVDEYQDTNRIQKELIRRLAGSHAVVCAVGDEDQSIYGWRGARVENILEFESDFPGSALIKLEQNYRSTKKILAAANSVISHNVGRRGKILWTENDSGPAVTFHQAEDDHAEAAFILDRTEEALRKGITDERGIAIFYRTHVQSRILEDECRRRSRPYRVFGGLRFYDRAEIKDALAFLKLAVNPKDNVSFVRVINSPARGIGSKTLERLAVIAQAREISFLEAIPHIEGGGKAEKALRGFHAWFDLLRKEIPSISPADAMEAILDTSGYREALEKENTVEADSRLDNLQELLRSMEEYSSESGGNVIDYLDRISLVTDADKYDPNLAAITMMTVHNSKGLEFDVVFVVGMEEGIFPHQRSIESGERDEVEEERRLCYVAMTRAKKILYLTAANRRRLYQSTQFNPVSRFVGEIPSAELIHIETPTHERTTWAAPKRARWKNDGDEFRQETYDEEVLSTGYSYHPGTRVLHPEFGLGTVKKCEGSPGNPKITIHFQRGGVKKLMANYCTLERVDG